MAWVVDTSVLLDIRLNDPKFGRASAECLARYLDQGLVLCPVTYVELAPAFQGDRRPQESFLRKIGVSWTEAWIWQDTEMAHWLWTEHVKRKRGGQVGKRLIADVLIEAFATRYQGLITRNPKDFTAVHLVVPR